MKYFLTTLLVAFLFSGCSTRNAFTQLDIDEKQKKAIEQTKSGQIVFDGKIKGIYSAIYLNNLDQSINPKTSQFYMSLYLKDVNSTLSIKLNNKKALSVVQLEEENKYSHLLPIKTPWRDNYLVTFKKTKKKKLTLKIDSGQFSSGPLKYSKVQQ